MMSPALRARAGDATEHLHQEMRVRMGEVPAAIAAPVYTEPGFVLARDAFLFTTASGVRFHYAMGEGIVASVPNPAAEDDFRLYLWGTVFGAVAWLNGYFPVHASAVAVGGRVVAFTADSGAGKSTLAAALAAYGLPHVCDDTLALCVTEQSALAIPDRKPLKLWEDAFDLVAAERLDPIGPMPGKSYARAATQSSSALPLTDLLTLEEGEEIGLAEVRGAAKLDVVVASMYRELIPAALGRRREYHRDLIALANGVRIWRLTRPRSADSTEFAQVTGRIADLIGAVPHPS